MVDMNFNNGDLKMNDVFDDAIDGSPFAVKASISNQQENEMINGNQPRRPELIWQNKWLISKATSIHEMAESLEDAAKLLRQLADIGIQLDIENSDMAGGFAVFLTDDPVVAEQFGFEEMDNEEDEDEDFELIEPSSK